MARAFVIRPFGVHCDSAGKQIDFDRIDRDLIAIAIEQAGCGGGTTTDVVEAGNIREDMFSLILEADVVICDITIRNANVFYELGIRHSLREKSTILIKGDPTADTTPFDLLTDRYLNYELAAPSSSIEPLAEMIKASRVSARRTDSPVFQMLPRLTPVDGSQVDVIPLKFSQEVELAAAKKSVEDLRSFFEASLGDRYEYGKLRCIGNAQWIMKDFGGARATFEHLVKWHAEDVDANLALANIYQRLSISSASQKSELLTRSDQAIANALNSRHLSGSKRVEALALKARNQKTRWRGGFEKCQSLRERRRKAMNRGAVQAFEAYVEAYAADLNHFWSGLAAIQMAAILIELSRDADWVDAFDSDEEAMRFKNRIQDIVAAFRTTVGFRVDSEMRAGDESSSDRMWAAVSRADLLFLDESENEQRVVNSYLNAVPRNSPFAWDAAKGQLVLFASLGFRTELVERIVNEFEDCLKR